MYYLVSVNNDGKTAHLIRIAVYPTQWMELMKMLWNVSSECEEDEGTDCEDGDSDSNW